MSFSQKKSDISKIRKNTIAIFKVLLFFLLHKLTLRKMELCNVLLFFLAFLPESNWSLEPELHVDSVSMLFFLVIYEKRDISEKLRFLKNYFFRA